jgi:HAD superfamily hydrolase (TIGR01490 family)
MSKAAFFDMDRTVLRVDSSTSWMRFMRRRGELSRAFVAKATWWALQYKLALLDIDSMADRVAADLSGILEAELIQKTALWHAEDLASKVAPLAVEAIEEHRRDGEVIVLLTGGSPYVARNVANALGIEHVLSTELEVKNGRFTGRLSQRCFGAHKVKVAEGWARVHGVELDEATFYSDSYNDLPMLERIGHPVAVNADPRLRRHALRKGWSLRSWA